MSWNKTRILFSICYLVGPIFQIIRAKNVHHKILLSCFIERWTDSKDHFYYKNNWKTGIRHDNFITLFQEQDHVTSTDFCSNHFRLDKSNIEITTAFCIRFIKLAWIIQRNSWPIKDEKHREKIREYDYCQFAGTKWLRKKLRFQLSYCFFIYFL